MSPAKNFSWKELECKCCGNKFINLDAIKALQNLRNIIGKPFIINSAARCRKHNQSVGGAASSKHISEEGQESTAFDISLNYPGGTHSQTKLAKWARACGFNGIGWYNTFLHIDYQREKDTYWDLRDGSDS